MGALHALQIETVLGLMWPRVNGVGLRGDLMGDSIESSVGPGRLFARWLRPEMDLLRSVGAMVGSLGCCGLGWDVMVLSFGLWSTELLYRRLEQ